MLLPILLIPALLFSCRKESVDDALVKVVEEEIVTFDRQSLPAGLTDALARNEITLSGETHYVQEHQEFITVLLPELSKSGYRIIFDELFHCFNWMIEDYLRGERATLPDFILYFNEELIEGIKAFNSTVPDSLHFQLVYMDANHWQANFPTCIEEIEKVIGPQSFFSSVKNAEVDSDAYLDLLSTMKTRLSNERDQYIMEWGEQWYDRIVEVVSVEIESSKYRRDRIDRNRENLMFDNITAFLQKHPGQKALVNTGMFHGQKATFMGNQFPRLGQLLKDFNDKTFSIAFIGMQGETKFRFDDTNNVSFNLVQNASDRNLTKIIHNIAGENQAFLPLQNEIFNTREQEITYDRGTTVTAPVGLQFDAIITYPRISILESMQKYDVD
jgi:hypothetical protein